MSVELGWQVSFQEIRAAAGTQLPEAPKRGILRGRLKAKGSCYQQFQLPALSVWFLGRPLLSSKTTANQLRCLTVIFIHFHWETLTLNHTGKETADFSSTMKTTQKRAEMMLVDTDSTENSSHLFPH